MNITPVVWPLLVVVALHNRCVYECATVHTALCDLLGAPHDSSLRWSPLWTASQLAAPVWMPFVSRKKRDIPLSAGYEIKVKQKKFNSNDDSVYGACPNNISVLIHTTSLMGILSTLLIPQTTQQLDVNTFLALKSGPNFKLSHWRFCLFEESRIITLYSPVIELKVLDNGNNKQASKSCFQSGKLLEIPV